VGEGEVGQCHGGGTGAGSDVGYRAQPIDYVLATVSIGAITANQGTPAVDVNRWPIYLSNGTGDIACTNTAAISLPGIGTTQVVAAVGGQRIRVCNVSLTLSSSSTLTFIEGTGANCVTGPANLSGAYLSVLGLSLFNPLSPLIGSASQALCITLGSAVTGGGTIIYSQY
jgi:hypothetical protein